MIKERKYDKRQKGTKIHKFDRNLYHWWFCCLALLIILSNSLKFVIVALLLISKKGGKERITTKTREFCDNMLEFMIFFCYY